MFRAPCGAGGISADGTGDECLMSNAEALPRQGSAGKYKEYGIQEKAVHHRGRPTAGHLRHGHHGPLARTRRKLADLSRAHAQQDGA